MANEMGGIMNHDTLQVFSGSPITPE